MFVAGSLNSIAGFRQNLEEKEVSKNPLMSLNHHLEALCMLMMNVGVHSRMYALFL